MKFSAVRVQRTTTRSCFSPWSSSRQASRSIDPSTGHAYDETMQSRTCGWNRSFHRDIDEKSRGRSRGLKVQIPLLGRHNSRLANEI